MKPKLREQQTLNHACEGPAVAFDSVCSAILY